jgi:hypothetical protein
MSNIDQKEIKFPKIEGGRDTPESILTISKFSLLSKLNITCHY